MKSKARGAKVHGQSLLEEIEAYIKILENISNIIIYNNFNQSITWKEIKKLCNKLGIIEIHWKHLNLKVKELDSIHIRRLNPINSIVVTKEILESTESYKLLETNNIIIWNYRGYFIDINFKDYFSK